MKKRLLIILLFAFPAADNFGQSKEKESSFRQVDFSVISQPSGYKIAGTISYPKEDKKFPAIILVWGTGPHTRDQVISGFPMFKLMADYFNQQGFAVLRIDKRGFGKSEGPPGSETVATTADLSNDVQAALQFLKTKPDVDSSQIGIIGHSEGAWIAEMTALHNPGIKWLALLGAHIINGEEVQINQMSDNLLRLGAKAEVVEKVRPQIRRYLEFVKSGYRDDSVYYSIGKDFLLAHGMPEKDITHKFIDQLLDGFKTPWYQYFLTNTPGLLIQQLKIPVFFVYGEEDENVSLSTNLLPLIDTIKKSGNKNISVSILPGLDHFFEIKKVSGWTLSEKLCPAIVNWLQSLTLQ